MTQLDTVSKFVGNTKLTSQPKRKRSKLRSRCWCFTWNNPDVDFVTQLQNSFEELKVQYVFQTEKVSTLHVQGAIYFKNPVEVGFQAVFSKKIHWEKGKNWRNLKKYCCKLESRVEGPWTNIQDLRYRKSIRDPLKGKVLYEWQKKVIDIIKSSPDDRTLWWFWDELGNTGKSALCKHLKLKYGDSLICVSGKMSDIAFGIKSRLDNGIDVDIVLMDIPRSSLGYVNYGMIEKLKDGYFYSGKYESGECMINSPHVLMFANMLPDISMCSEDRWKIIEVKKD